MRHVATLEGKGKLLLEGAQPTEVNYSLHAFEQGGLKEARDVVTGDPNVLWEFFNVPEARLQLKDGSLITVLAKGGSAESGEMEIVVSGSIPNI